MKLMEAISESRPDCTYGHGFEVELDPDDYG